MNFKKISLAIVGSIAVSTAYASAYSFDLTPNNGSKKVDLQTLSCPNLSNSDTGMKYQAAAENYQNAKKALNDQKNVVAAAENQLQDLQNKCALEAQAQRRAEFEEQQRVAAEAARLAQIEATFSL